MNVEEEARRIAPLVILEMIEDSKNAAWLSDSIWANTRGPLPTDEVMDALENRIKTLFDSIKITIED